MSHNRIIEDFPRNVDKSKVQDEYDSYVRHADWQEGASGLPGKIRWIEKVCGDRDEAENYIMQRDSGNYDQLAVMYRVMPSDEELCRKSKEFAAQKARVDALEQRLREMSEKIHYAGVKASTISCRSCRSKIDTAYIGINVINHCPVCRKDLRPESTLQAIQNAKKSLLAAAQRLEQMRKAHQSKSAEIRWLVKIEYHS